MEIEKKKQWHPAFCAAVELEFREDKEILQYEREYLLSKKPLQVDLLIIKKSADRILKNEIGDFFLGHNLMEYKSPKDALDIDVFYKVLGYACIYKAEAEGVDKVLDTDITISLIREKKPVKLLKQLSEKYRVTEKTAGVYRVEGFLFPLQILVTGDLDKKLHAWLHSLTDSLEYDDAENLLTNCSSLEDSTDRKNAGVIVDFISNANESLFLQILKEDDRMTEAIEKLVAPELISLRLVIENKEKELENSKKKLADKDAELADKNAKLADKDAKLADKDAKLADKDAKLADKDAEIERLKQQLMEATHQNRQIKDIIL